MATITRKMDPETRAKTIDKSDARQMAADKGPG